MKGVQRYVKTGTDYILKPYRYVRDKFREYFRLYTAPGTRLHPLAVYMGDKFRNLKRRYKDDEDIKWFNRGKEYLPELKETFRVCNSLEIRDLLFRSHFAQVVNSGSAYGQTLKFCERTKSSLNVRFHNALENPSFAMLLDRLYIYSAPSTTEVNEYGKPIHEKWTLHRMISEIRGVTTFLSTDERVFLLSLFSIFVFYVMMGLINYMQVGDENDFMNLTRDLQYLNLQKEVIELKKLHLQLAKLIHEYATS
ncbi:unnamed protein product [Moneuplotes crassus]|uniref:Uncharacterized protein n=1 Tax=Euplotes crassus TaxID=5936 RepID=A0AAD1XPL7_EUPCR|nr:unnamed protein product [Moneuplotes crassus]